MNAGSTWRIAAAAVAAMLFCARAFGHAVLLSSVPADGSAVPAVHEVVLHFNEPVRPVSIRLLGAGGRNVLQGNSPVVEDSVVRVPAHGLEAGTYVLSYRVVSADAHPVSGSLVFRVGDGLPPPRSPGIGRERHAQWHAAQVVNRAIQLIALLGGVGGALYAVLIGQIASPAARHAVLGACALALLTAVTDVGLRGVVMMDGESPGRGPAVWQAGFQSTRGLAGMTVGIGIVLAATGFWLSRVRLAGVTTVVGAILSVTGFIVSGHGASTQPLWASRPAWLVHTAVALFWIGSLVPMLASLRTNHAAAELSRFSSIAIVAVPCMLVAGSVMAYLQLGEPGHLVDTVYGNLLSLKLLAVLLLLALAAANRFLLLARVRAHQGGRRALSMTVSAESGLAVVILVLTAALSHEPPPRSALPRPLASVDTTAEAVSGGLSASITVSPEDHGRRTILVALTGTRPGQPLEVSIELSQASAGIEPIIRTMDRLSPGLYRYEGGDLSVPGQWTVRIHLLVTDFEKVTLTTTVSVR